MLGGESQNNVRYFFVVYQFNTLERNSERSAAVRAIVTVGIYF
jgi:hypothetical protein